MRHADFYYLWSCVILFLKYLHVSCFPNVLGDELVKAKLKYILTTVVTKRVHGGGYITILKSNKGIELAS